MPLIEETQACIDCTTRLARRLFIADPEMIHDLALIGFVPADWAGGTRFHHLWKKYPTEFIDDRLRLTPPGATMSSGGCAGGRTGCTFTSCSNSSPGSTRSYVSFPELNHLEEIRIMLTERVLDWTQQWKQEGLQEACRRA